MMCSRAPLRSVLAATLLLLGMGPSLNALAHGAAHAHEAEHREQAEVEAHGHSHDHEPALAPAEHHHEHHHAIVGLGLKPRSDAPAFIASNTTELPLAVSISVTQAAFRAAGAEPPPPRRHTPASPRAPPAR